MQRILGALREGRCAIAVGSRAWQDPNFVAGVAERTGLPLMALGGTSESGVPDATPEALGAALGSEGGVLVLVEPDPLTDGAALKALNSGIGAWSHKPRLVVVAKQFNPFLFPTPLRTLKYSQVKQRSREFMEALPIPAAEAEAKAPKSSRNASGRAPQLTFLGREVETAALLPMVQAGGPVVVSGPPGVGRMWLIDRAVSQDESLSRVPDLFLARGVGFTTLASRLLEMTGAEEHRALLVPDTRVGPVETVAKILEVLQDEALKGKVFVISGLQYHLARDGSIWREDRLGMLIEALLSGTYAPTIVFRTTREPTFFREGDATDLKRLAVGGLKGRELYDLFSNYDAGEIARDKMGLVHDRTFGHPIATRLFAITWRDAENREKLLDDPKFFKLKSPDDTESLRRRLQRRLEKLDEEQRGALALLAHLPEPVPATVISALGVNRATRLELLRVGLLDGLSERSPKEYHVHPVVADLMGRRETSDFDTLEHVAQMLLESSSASEPGLPQLHLIQLGNRLLVEARRERSQWGMPWPDHDSRLHSIRDMLGARQPRLDLAEQFTRELAKRDPGNPETQMLLADVLIARGAEPKAIGAVFHTAQQAMPTPELFHAEAGWQLSSKGGVGRAIACLERAVAAFPENARLKRRLANVLLDQGRPTDAETLLRAALDLQPMMPDTYSLLGKLALTQGAEAWDKAEELLREARRLDPEGVQHQDRLGSLLRQRGLADADKRTAYWDEAKELLEGAIKGNSRNGRAYLELALLHLDRLAVGLDADMERAEWLLRKANKMGQARTEIQLALARVQARTGKARQAAETLDRLQQKMGATPAVMAARGELEAFAGQIFRAEHAFNAAFMAAPEGSPEKALILAELTRLRALIESGAALDIVKQAEAREAGEAADRAVTEAAAGPRREAGTTTKRRRGGKGRKKGGGDDAAAEAAPDQAEADEAAPVEAAVEAAPVEAAVEAAPVEAAPVEAAAIEDVVPAEPVVEASPEA